MDLQKEREAFEDWYCKNHTGLKQSDLAKFRTLSDYSFSDSLKINIAWEAWQAAKAVPEGFVVVPRKSIEHWYLDEGECLWMDEPDNWLCDMDVGDVQEVEHKEYIVTESNTLYATKVWDGENQNVSSWEFFNSKDDAEKAAEYCKAMIEAQE